MPDDIRLKRIAARSRSGGASGEGLAEAVAQLDARELGWGIGDAIRSVNIFLDIFWLFWCK